MTEPEEQTELDGQIESLAYATKIFKKYGWDSIKIVSQNPYRLASDILGIGFLTADKIAGSMGFEKNAPARVKAGMLYVLHQLSEERHVYFPYEPQVDKCKEILDVDRENIGKAIGRITSLDEETREVTVTYDGVPVPYDLSDLEEIVHAYAISVHKSQ